MSTESFQSVQHHRTEREGDDFTIEPLSPDDVSSFAQHMQTGTLSQSHRSEDENSRQAFARGEGHYREMLASETSTLLAGKDAGGKIIAGLEAELIIFEGNTFGHIEFVCTSEAWQNKGVAGQLIREYERSLRRQGEVSSLVVYIDHENEESRALHQSLGVDRVIQEDETGAWYCKIL